MRAKRVDANQPEIVKLFRKLGATFQHTHTVPGALDGIVGYRGVDVRVEIKDPRQSLNARKLTEAEEKTIKKWKGRTPVIIETDQDVIDLLFQLSRG